MSDDTVFSLQKTVSRLHQSWAELGSYKVTKISNDKKLRCCDQDVSDKKMIHLIYLMGEEMHDTMTSYRSVWDYCNVLCPFVGLEWKCSYVM